MTQTDDVGAVLGRYAAAVDQEIRDELAEGLGEWLRQAIEYHFGWRDEQFQPVEGGNSGKKLRPVMALLAYQGALESQQPGQGLKANLAAALPLAACLEMIHNYSLIHDDIEDEDRMRRGRATLWSIWGQAKAINVGDCLDMLAFRKLLRSAERGVSADKVVRLAQTVTDTSVKLTVGQDADMSFEQNLAVTADMYIRMISGKTAALIRCAVYSGALLGLDLADSSQAARLEQFGYFGEQIGLGFQVRDDILGIWGQTADTGKASGNDIRRRKKSLPIIVAFNETKGEKHERLLDIYRRSDPLTADEEQFVMQVLEECAAQDYCQQAADRYKANALQALTEAAGGPAAIEANPPLRQLRDLCTFLVERNY